CLLLGLLPYVDQFAHFGGLIFGTLSSIALLPFVTLSQAGQRWQHVRRIVAASACIGLLTTIFILLYTESYPDCDFCHYIDCVEFVPGICNLDVRLDPNISAVIT
ncbi:uncharacterized protein MONBRDRAFT_33232, partial [Monosiga brevicollis MX1]